MLPSPEIRLQTQLDAITANTRVLVQPERLARTEAVVEALRATGMVQDLPAPGSAAPPFTLAASTGRQVRSADLHALGPVIVKFFRGRWCPYDMTELEAWQAQQAEIRARRALFVAISPQTPRQNAFTAEQHRLTFPVLSDPRATVAAQFGLGYTVPEPDREWYRSMLVNIPFLNGDDSWRLPLPGVFVLTQGSTAAGEPGGVVQFREAHADHRVRPEPAAVLAALQAAPR